MSINKKKCIVFMIGMFLTGCSTPVQSLENTTSIENTNPLNHENILVDELDNYSGKWSFWNNEKLEADGGVSLFITISDQIVNARISAWSKNYEHLAEADLTGTLQDNKVRLPFDDSRNGQNGIVHLSFENNTILMNISIDEDSLPGKVAFPEGQTLLHKTSDTDKEAAMYYSDGEIHEMQIRDIEKNYITDRTTGLNHYYIDSQNTLWGTGHNDYWQLGIENEHDRNNLSAYYYEPVKIAENVIHVDASDNGYFAVFLNEEKELFGLGANTNGILRQPVQEYEELNRFRNILAKPVKLMSHVQFVSVGRESLSVLDEEGTVWWWGRFNSSTITQSKIPPMYSEEPKCMVKNALYTICGADFAAAIDEDNHLWTWGNNTWGQCGTPVNIDYIEEAVTVAEEADMVWIELLSSKQNTFSTAEINDHNPYSNIIYPYTMFVRKKDGNIYACGINLGNEKRRVQILGDIENEEGDGFVSSYSSQLVPIKVRKSGMKDD